MISQQHILLSDVCQLGLLIYINQATTFLTFWLSSMLYASSIIILLLCYFLKKDTWNQRFESIGIILKIISLWIAQQYNFEFMFCSLIQSQMFFQKIDLKKQQKQSIMIVFQMVFNLFQIREIIKDTIITIINLFQVIIFFVWIYRVRKHNFKNQQNAKLQQGNVIIEIDDFRDSQKQHQKFIHTSSTKRVILPQNTLIFNQEFELIDCQIDFKELINHQSQSDQVIQIMLSLKLNYIIEKESKSCEIKQLMEQLQLDQRILGTIEKNDYIKYENNVLLISCQLFEDLRCYQIEIVQVPQKHRKVEIEESIEIDMCRSLSHELGTNLNSIITFTAMALDDEKIDKCTKLKYLDPIWINCEQLNLIVGSIRDYNLINLQQFSLKLEELDLQQEIKFMVSLFQDSIESKQIKVDCKFDLQCYQFIGDKIRFRQVLFQLLQNAIKYTFQSSITIGITNDQLECKVLITDDGVGMTEEEAENLNSLLRLNKFIRVSEQSVGIGLGLGISNQLVKQMGNQDNQIELKRLVKGCQFSFSIKNHYDELTKEFSRQKSSFFPTRNNQTIRFISANSYYENQIREYSHSKNGLKSSIVQNNSKIYRFPLTIQISLGHDLKSQKEESSSISSIHPPILSPKFQQSIIQCSLKSDCCSRVLIVDDEYFNIQCLKLLMLKYQSKCDAAYNGNEAINQVLEKKNNACQICGNKFYSLIFLDINMPIMDGFNTVKELKRMMSEQIINKSYCIANTGFCDLDTKLKSYDSGMDYYLTKPLDQKELNKILNDIYPMLIS
ncbi:unnamed protein product [Paramecium sonneborni]|uniref:Uncharacterized protein n=1 Tax=Paramecium sonneborni TaxID=65129 RepID=A0A8S1R8Y5_9CILI|nr:unnamed protein product [Paramecium sonneborni]